MTSKISIGTTYRTVNGDTLRLLRTEDAATEKGKKSEQSYVFLLNEAKTVKIVESQTGFLQRFTIIEKATPEAQRGQNK
jgi:hypothetical protein